MKKTEKWLRKNYSGDSLILENIHFLSEMIDNYVSQFHTGNGENIEKLACPKCGETLVWHNGDAHDPQNRTNPLYYCTCGFKIYYADDFDKPSSDNYMHSEPIIREQYLNLEKEELVTMLMNCQALIGEKMPDVQTYTTTDFPDIDFRRDIAHELSRDELIDRLCEMNESYRAMRKEWFEKTQMNTEADEWVSVKELYKTLIDRYQQFTKWIVRHTPEIKESERGLDLLNEIDWAEHKIREQETNN